MNIYISQEASNWFQHEMEAENGDTVRFFARYGGSSALHEGFSLGVTKDTPEDPGVTHLENDVTYFIEEKDIWYFDGHDLYVEFDQDRNELYYEYKK
ncbi:hypothetical protein Q73_06810 [Bacillus coahuilensis m2-6]|uniref:HesB/YadR/YfhF family protein n=1 Tax=Bacillus coahuilensis TaxID=408580 RepID=UPI000750087D|nr:HesB/YadR/YfhF family protein [Bacillus coahuilensis]KUP08225.1 hypothetical protein Q73_06810 [Bacillus coahuilensis m2-6]